MDTQKLSQRAAEYEAMLVNVLMHTSPWLAPIAPAYMAYINMTERLRFNFIIAGVVAFSIEALGVVTISLSITFWRHNLRYKDAKHKSPVWIPLCAYAFYLLVVLSVNAFMELRWVDDVLIKAMLTLLSLPAAITLAINKQHTELLLDMKTEREERRKQSLDRKAIDAVDKAQLHAIDNGNGSQLTRVDAVDKSDSSKLTQIDMIDRTQLHAIDTVDAMQLTEVAVKGLSGGSKISQLTRLTGNRLKVFKILKEDPYIPQAEIARKIGITRQAVANHVTAIKSDGLV